MNNAATTRCSRRLLPKIIAADATIKSQSTECALILVGWFSLSKGLFPSLIVSATTIMAGSV